MVCNVLFKDLTNKQKHRHHNHMKKPVFTTEKYKNITVYRCIEGNYIGASCRDCNWKITHKRNNVSVLFHNFSGYDGPLLMSGLVANKNRLKSMNIVPKGATGYHMIQYKNIKMIDSCSFMQGSLSSLVGLLCKNIDPNSPDKTLEKLLPRTVQLVKKSQINNNVIPLLTNKLVW